MSRSSGTERPGSRSRFPQCANFRSVTRPPCRICRWQRWSTSYHAEPPGRTWFTVDQPSQQFASFGIPEITDVGIELDHKLAALLDTLAVPVPADLRE
jgi:hypothetical protein